MKVIAILSHLMNKDGVLNKESKERIKIAIKLYDKRNCGLIITSGWAYRQDCSLAIADVVASYIKQNYSLNKINIVSITDSRDTVGDAFYLKKKLKKIKCSKLLVVTSDYHVSRAKIIFNTFMKDFISIEVMGANTNLIKDNKTLSHEKKSVLAFKKTFNGIDFKNEEQIFYAMRNYHPFYNGTKYPKISQNC